MAFPRLDQELDLGNVVFGIAFEGHAGIRKVDLPFERGFALGTARCSVHEYRLGRRPTKRSGLFSLAIITYKMGTHGGRPFGEKFERANGMRDFAAVHYVPASRSKPHVTTWLDGVLKRAMSWDPAGRKECLSDFLTQLKRPNLVYILPADAPLLG